MDLVHCMLCGSFPSREKSAFCLSNCGHIYCKECVDKGRVAQCRMCKTNGPKFVPIDHNLPLHLKILFKDVGEVWEEFSNDLTAAINFQNAQRALRLKMQNLELQSRLERTEDEVNRLKRMNHELSRSRNSSVDSGHHRHSRASAADVSDSSHLSHHTTASSDGLNATTMTTDPFKTPFSGPKRYVTSTPKAPVPIEKNRKSIKYGNLMNGRPTSSIPSLSPYPAAMETNQTATVNDDDDDDIMDVTPAVLPTTSRPLQQHPQPQHQQQPPKMKSLMVASDPLLPSSSSSSRRMLPKTPAPAPKRSDLSMAARLNQSATSAAAAAAAAGMTSMHGPPPNAAARTTPKTPLMTPLMANMLRTPAAAAAAGPTPQLPATLVPYTAATPAMRAALGDAKRMKASTPLVSTGFRTPALPAVKKVGNPQTMPAGIKTGGTRTNY